MKNNTWQHQKYDIHYYTAGYTGNPILIFMHGFLGSGLDWGEVIDHLAKDFYCIAPDLPGHGKSRVKISRIGYTMASFSDVFCCFLHDIGVQTSSLIGYSMGGRLALFLSIQYSHLWQAVVLESVSPGLRTARERGERLKKDAKIANQLETKPFDKFLTGWYGQPLFNSLRQNDKFSILFTRRLENDPDLLAISLRMMGLGNQTSFWKAIQYIETPILLLTGEYDCKFCNILGEAHSIFPNSELHIIEKAGHNAHFEQPLSFFKLVDKFIKKNVAEIQKHE